MIARKTIVVPCIVKSWLYISADTSMAVRSAELGADYHRLQSADDEEEERREEVEHADPLVVGGREPAPRECSWDDHRRRSFGEGTNGAGSAVVAIRWLPFILLEDVR